MNRMVTMNEKWTLNSWRDFPIKQVPAYEDAEALQSVEERLAGFRRLFLLAKHEA